MRITLNAPEALFLALRGKPLPPGLENVQLRDDVVTAQLDLREISTSRRLRLAAAAAGTVSLAARFESFAAGTATFALQAEARGLPAHKVLNLVTGHLDEALADGLRAAGLPAGLLTIDQGASGPCLLVRLDDAVQLVLPQAHVASFDVAAGQIHTDVQLPAEV
ncbi:MAG: hypothetical protein ACTMIR_14255 [Cellulomonadaceae bacterium]